MKLQKEDDEYYLIDDSNDTIATTDKVMLKECGDVKKLSKENCDSIFGIVDVGALALEECNNTDPLRLDSQKYKQDPYFRIGYLKGFNKATDLNKDKLFTVDDLYRVFLINSAGNNTTLRNFFKKIVLPMFDKPSEIDVEFEMELVSDGLDEMAQPQHKKVPKLDKNLCLILKKK